MALAKEGRWLVAMDCVAIQGKKMGTALTLLKSYDGEFGTGMTEAYLPTKSKLPHCLR